MRIVRTALFVAGVAFLVYLVLQIGTQSIGEALSRLAWWQFALLCLPHGTASSWPSTPPSREAPGGTEPTTANQLRLVHERNSFHEREASMADGTLDRAQPTSVAPCLEFRTGSNGTSYLKPACDEF
jgi:hypothetical protein